uniref:Uncharacterized protein n=1 Tax=Anguilla anguilla TaxID=7936 RepID=A0A0E9RJI6_ANGAN
MHRIYLAVKASLSYSNTFLLIFLMKTFRGLPLNV